MNIVTIAIPDRWARAAARILLFFKEEMERHGDAIRPYEVKIAPEIDPGQIFVVGDSSLNMQQELQFNSALGELNAALNTPDWDEWQASKEATDDSIRLLEEIRRTIDDYLDDSPRA